jgi:hypothetical protein
MGTNTLVRKALLISRSSSHLKNSFGTKPTVIPEGIERASNAFITRLDLPPSAGDLVENPEPELAGLTVAIKDIFCMRGSVTTCASAALKGKVVQHPPFILPWIRLLE